MNKLSSTTNEQMISNHLFATLKLCEFHVLYLQQLIVCNLLNNLTVIDYKKLKNFLRHKNYNINKTEIICMLTINYATTAIYK